MSTVKIEPKEEPIPITNSTKNTPNSSNNNSNNSMTKDQSPQITTTNNSPNKRPRRFKMCLLFQQAEVGPIIGKSGANIKAIKQNCGCDLNFYDLYQRNRTLVILGEKPNIPVAIELIAGALKEDDQNKTSSADNNGAVNGHERGSRVSIFWILPRDHAISLIGKDGANSKRVRDDTQASVSVLFGDDQSSPELLVRITGTPKEISNAVQLCIEEFIKDQGKYGRTPLRPTTGFDGFRRRLLSQGGRGFRYTPSKYRGPDQFKIESTQTIQLPRDLAGAVIGKGGGNITRIRNISGANIKINTPEKEDDLATVVVVGRPSSVAVAFELIEECIQIFLAHGVRLKAAAESNTQISAKSVNGVEFEQEITHLLINPKNGYVIVGYGQGKIKIIKRGTQIMDQLEYSNKIKFMMLVGDALLFVDEQNTLIVQQMDNHEVLLEISMSSNNFDVTALCHPSTYLNKILFGGRDGCLQLWNIKTGRLIHSFEKSWDDVEITALEQSTAVDVVAVGLANGSICLLNLKSGSILYKFHQNFGSVTCISFRTDGFGFMATGSPNGHITIWDLDHNQLAYCIMEAHESTVTTLAYLPNSTILLSTSDDNSIKEWIFDAKSSSSHENLSDEGQARLYKYRCGHCSPIQKLRFYYSNTKATVNTNNQYTILSCGDDNSLRYFNLYRDEQNCEISQGRIEHNAKKKKVDLVETRLNKIVDFSFANEREYFWDNCVTCHKKDHYPRTWNIKNRKIGKHLLGHNTKSSFNIDGQFPLVCEMTRCGNLVVVGYNKGSVVVFNVQSGLFYKEFLHKKSRAHDHPIVGICVDSINKFMVTVDESGVTKFWNFHKSIQLGQVYCQVERIYHVRLHSENLLMAVAFKDTETNKNHIKVLDIQSRATVRISSKDRDFKYINDMTFSADGKWLIIATADGLLSTWDIVTNQLIDCFVTDHVVQSLDISPGGDFLVLAYSGQRGIHVLANKFIFDPTTIVMPLQANYNPLKNKKAITNANEEVEPIVQPNDEDDWQAVVHRLMNAKRNYNKVLMKIALVPESRWFSLANIDLIKERNKPKQSKIILKSAPFFLPTVQGLNPTFEDGSNEKQSNNSDLSIRFKRLKTTDSVSPLIQMLKKYRRKTLKDVENIVEYLIKLNPCILDCELNYLSVDMEGSVEVLLKFVIFLGDLVDLGRYFEFSQGVLSLFLKLHSKTILCNHQLFKKALAILLDKVEYRHKCLEPTIGQSLCILDFIKSNKISF